MSESPGQMPPEPIAPYTLRLVRSSDVFAYLHALLKPARIEWLNAMAAGGWIGGPESGTRAARGGAGRAARSEGSSSFGRHQR